MHDAGQQLDGYPGIIGAAQTAEDDHLGHHLYNGCCLQPGCHDVVALIGVQQHLSIVEIIAQQGRDQKGVPGEEDDTHGEARMGKDERQEQ